MNAKQLKQAILHYAMQGKLVEQTSSDESTSVLLEKIKKEKEELIKKKVIKREKELGSIMDEETPYEIPDSWKWVKLGEIGRWGAGSTPARSNPKYYGGDIPWLKTGELTDGLITETDEFITKLALEKTSVKLNPVGSVLIAMYGATIGKLGILTFEATTNQACCACVPYSGIDNKFLFYYLMSERRTFIGSAEGGAQPNISRTKIVNFRFPLPSLAEQQRIVTKIEELFKKVDEYGILEQEITSLDKYFPPNMEKSILQHAMQGKLVEQDLNDEPASQLIERIKKEKLELVEQKFIKKEKPLPLITEEEIPFDIPGTWQWARLNEVAIYIQRGKSPKYSLIKSTPVISQKCVQWSGFTMEPAKFIEQDTLEKYDKIRFLQSGDLLWNSTGLGTIGRVALYDDSFNPYEQAVADSHVTVVRTSELIDSQYIYYYLASPEIQNSIEDIASGSTKQKELNTSTIKEILVPIPPLNEQIRIVDKLKEVLSIIKYR